MHKHYHKLWVTNVNVMGIFEILKRTNCTLGRLWWYLPWKVYVHQNVPQNGVV